MRRINPGKITDGIEYPIPNTAEGKDVLCYADQGTFVSLRGLGHQPIIHFNWVYTHLLDESEVEQFNVRLAEGFLGRLLQRSPLPWGRHRWVANPHPAPVTWLRDPIPVEALPKWRNSLLDLPVDPEYGPGWRLAVQFLEGGGATLSLLISHTIADVTAAAQAISDAVVNKYVAPGFPAPSARWSPARLVRDSVESARALPDVWCALMTALRSEWTKSQRESTVSVRWRRLSRKIPDPVVSVPLVYVAIDKKVCDDRAEDLGIKINTLLTAFAARLAFRIGRVDPAGCVELVLPVSIRQPGDWRGNALQAATLRVDPQACLLYPHEFQKERRAAIETALLSGHDLSALLPLIPYLPLWLVRYFEKKVSGVFSVGCSFTMDFPQGLLRPFGQVSFFQLSGLERYTASGLNRLGGRLFIAFYRLDQIVSFSVSCYMRDRITSCAEVAPFVQEALKDLGLEGTIS
jgi:diacylglycerol O-acyltransferase